MRLKNIFIGLLFIFTVIVNLGCEKENNRMVDLNYGKYPVPETLKQIISLQDELNKEGKLPYGDLLGYYFSLAEVDTRYLNTPLDVIQFAHPGSDGIHYGFLTDFGQVDHLEDAYIVRVSPVDFDEPVKIVARNLRDFMRIICFSPNAMDMFDIQTTEAEFNRYAHEIPSLSELADYDRSEARDIFQKEFQLEPIKNLYDYLQQVKEERNLAAVFPTEDGIGVVQTPQLDDPQPIQPMKLERQQDLDLEQVKQFFESATYHSKLVFLRDSQSKGLIYDNEAVKNFLKQQLKLMNLNDEAERISYPH